MIQGIPASKGYAIGNIFVKPLEEFTITKDKITNIQDEKIKFEQAIIASCNELKLLVEKTEKEVGSEEAKVFESHIMFLDDPEFTGAAMNAIEEESISGAYAMEKITQMYVAIFSEIEDAYMRERIADIKDVSQRIIRHLLNKAKTPMDNLPPNTILVAHDLTPSDTAQIDKNHVSGFVTEIGGTTSHSVIIARTLGIPAVVGTKTITSQVNTGDLAILDGIRGEIILQPDQETVQYYETLISDYEAQKKRLRTFLNKRTSYPNGKKIEVVGNIGLPSDVDYVIENGGEGVGLFRTEFLFMDRTALPSEEEQYNAYTYVVEKLDGKPLIVRTLDIGGDKTIPYLNLDKEENPFLGYRAIRICLDQQGLFLTQLRALLRASSKGNLSIMFPMISSLEELLEAKELLEVAKEQLRQEGVDFNPNLCVGVMIEIPAAALIADVLAKHVDFFSIGTNDLTQYTIAVDRMNEKISHLYNPMHPSVLKLIKMTIEAAHNEGKWCGMCGELAADERAIKTLLSYGLDEFSVSPTSILSTRQCILEEFNQ